MIYKWFKPENNYILYMYKVNNYPMTKNKLIYHAED